MLNDIVSCNSSKIKSLTTALNCIENFVNFRCRKNKNYIFRRFFQRFQQRIKRMVSQHVNFIDNIDFILAMHGNILNFFQNALRIFNFSVTCSIDFNNVHRNRIHNI